MANAVSRTSTYSRFSLLELQVRTMVRETTDVSKKSLDNLSRALASPHYVEVVIVTAFNRNNKIGARMTMTIDWRQHELTIASGGDALRVPSSWVDGVSPSLDEIIRTFNQAKQEGGLAAEWSVVYSKIFDRAAVQKKLGFVSAPAREWAGTPVSFSSKLGPLDEVQVMIEIASD